MNTNHPLLVRIRELQQEERSGFLRLARDRHHILLCFQNGLIASAGSSLPPLQLGRFISRRGILPNGDLPKLLQYAGRKRMILGKAAVARRVLEEADLREALCEQVVQAVSQAMSRDFAIGRFEDAAVDLYLPVGLDFERLVLELARANLRPLDIDPYRMIVLTNGRRLSHLPWYPQELSVLSRLETPRTLEDLAMSTGLDYERLSKILGVFDTLRLIGRVDVPPSESTALVKRESFPYMHLTPEIGEAGVSAKLEAFHNPTSFISEQFKTLKVRIDEIAAQMPLRVIAISSPQPADGKSLVSANFAASLSLDPGRKVVLVDCDMRNPSLQKLLGTSAEPGLLGYLESQCLPPYCYMRRLDKLFFVTAGGVSDNPVELLSHARMKDLVEYLKREFDTVILDCPPFGPISDAQVLTRLADGLLMVLRSGKTTYGTMEKALSRFERSKLMGVVFNDVKPLMYNTQYPYQYYHYRSAGAYPYKAARRPPRPRNYLD